MTTLDRALCPDCGRVLAVRPPGGGDTSVDVFPRHPQPTGRRCPSSRTKVKPKEYVPTPNGGRT